MTMNKIDRINNQIRKIKEELHKMGPIRPGTLSRQYKSPEKKAGAYWQVSYTRKMKSHTEYIRLASVPEIRRQITTYKRFKVLIDRWLELSIEYSKLTMQLSGDNEDKTTK
jgi:hypothetical protein